jgi:hypothetical protein
MILKSFYDVVQQTDIIPEADEKYDLLNYFAKSKSDVENELKKRRERVRDLKWYSFLFWIEFCGVDLTSPSFVFFFQGVFFYDVLE